MLGSLQINITFGEGIKFCWSCEHERHSNPVLSLQDEGEKTVVLKANSSSELDELEAKAQSLLLPTFLVRDPLGV